MLVIVGAVAMMAFTAAAFAGQPEFGNFTDAAASPPGSKHMPADRRRAVRDRADRRRDHRRVGGVAVDGLCDRRRVLGPPFAAPQAVAEAKGFYAVYAGLIAVAAALVLTPGSPLGLLTDGGADAGRRAAAERDRVPAAAVQRQARCSGPWVNARWLNLFTGAVIAVLVMLSIILTASVLFPDAIERSSDRSASSPAAAVVAVYRALGDLVRRPSQRRRN